MQRCVEQARRKSMMLCQRFKRRMRQCGAHGEIQRASDIYQGGENEPITADREVLVRIKDSDQRHSKNYPIVVALKLRALLISQI